MRILRNACYALLPFVALLLLQGCGGGSGSPSTNFSKVTTGPLSVSPTQGTAVPGLPTVFTLHLNSSVTPAGPVALNVTGLPGQAVAAFAPDHLTLSGGVPGISTLTITTDSAIPAGDYPLLIQGTVNNALFGSAQVTLHVPPAVAENQGFALFVDPPAAETQPAGPTIFTVILFPAPGFHDNVRVNVSGGNGSFIVENPAQDTLALAGRPVQTTFRVSQTAGARPGSAATLTVTATNGAFTQTARILVQSQ